MCKRRCVYIWAIPPLAWPYVCLACRSHQQADATEAEASSLHRGAADYSSSNIRMNRQYGKAVWQTSLVRGKQDGAWPCWCMTECKCVCVREGERERMHWKAVTLCVLEVSVSSKQGSEFKSKPDRSETLISTSEIERSIDDAADISVCQFNKRFQNKKNMDVIKLCKLPTRALSTFKDEVHEATEPAFSNHHHHHHHHHYTTQSYIIAHQMLNRRFLISWLI